MGTSMCQRSFRFVSSAEPEKTGTLKSRTMFKPK